MTASTQKELHDKSIEDILIFRQALDRESDRGCALFAVSYIDDALGMLLKASLVSGSAIDKDLLGGTAPLSTFSSRILMSFYLGKISQDCRRDLDLLRKIRNDFAHNSKAISFSESSIADRCRELSFSFREKKTNPRAHFTSAICSILAEIHRATEESTRLVSPDSILPDENLRMKIESQVNQVEQEEHNERI